MLSGLAGHNDANSIKNYMKGTAKFLKAMSLILSRKMGQNQSGRFEEVVYDIEEAEQKERVERVGDLGEKRGSGKEDSTAQSLVPSAPTPQMLAQSPSSPTPQTPLLPGITPFGFPVVTFQQQMLAAQQLSLAPNPMLMMAPQT